LGISPSKDDHSTVSVEHDYEKLAREVFRGHLADLGLDARHVDRGVQTGIGDIVVDFEVDSIDPQDTEMHVVFWAHLDDVPGVRPPRISLDLVGIGPDSAEALLNGIHFVVDGVVPVLRYDQDRGERPEGIQVATYTSMTDGRATVWDLVTGPPAVGGDSPEAGIEAIKSLAFMQGIVDSIVDVTGSVQPHWFKLLVIRGPDHKLIGDVKVDGFPVGVSPSFDSDRLPEGTVMVRQFGLVRPTDRQPDADTLRMIREHEAAATDERPWWRRLPGSR
jgi:hypothetical protein